MVLREQRQQFPDFTKTRLQTRSALDKEPMPQCTLASLWKSLEPALELIKKSSNSHVDRDYEHSKTSPVLPSICTSSPSLMDFNSPLIPTTAGIPSSLATMAA